MSILILTRAFYWFPATLYVHALSAPVVLILVSLLVLFRLEKRRRLHRFLGKVSLVLLFIAVILRAGCSATLRWVVFPENLPSSC